ncbi:MAG: hypothetical protein EZS26_000972 [Candidatus Ordinivivax streblomastigis]|uniref:Uncharacterized protein n=1 Tax=Candidatus Ordinivivax streblomastigis TaxID=2540710 RepID=A0A5M8P384_9BACT|nr:MAG: hypothetical protein EZS26_000972 [Candidatus Ordinivivax streblomastigis]
MSLQKKFNKLHQEIVDALCRIEEFPEGLLPHTVYVEEGGDDSQECGNSVYNLYNLIKIRKDGSCILEHPKTGKEEERQLNKIITDWLIVVWDYYLDLSGTKEPEPTEKELAVFLYPVESFERNATDEEIISGWEDGSVEKLTPDEFAAMINDEGFNGSADWVRFIETEV